MLIHCKWESGYRGAEISFESLLDSRMMDGNRQFYWSVPAALLVRFRGDALGEALSVNTMKRSDFCHHIFMEINSNVSKQITCLFYQLLLSTNRDRT